MNTTLEQKFKAEIKEDLMNNQSSVTNDDGTFWVELKNNQFTFTAPISSKIVYYISPEATARIVREVEAELLWQYITSRAVVTTQPMNIKIIEHAKLLRQFTSFVVDNFENETFMNIHQFQIPFITTENFEAYKAITELYKQNPLNKPNHPPVEAIDMWMGMVADRLTITDKVDVWELVDDIMDMEGGGCLYDFIGETVFFCEESAINPDYIKKINVHLNAEKGPGKNETSNESSNESSINEVSDIVESLLDFTTLLGGFTINLCKLINDDVVITKIFKNE